MKLVVGVTRRFPGTVVGNPGTGVSGEMFSTAARELGLLMAEISSRAIQLFDAIFADDDCLSQRPERLKRDFSIAWSSTRVL